MEKIYLTKDNVVNWIDQWRIDHSTYTEADVEVFRKPAMASTVLSTIGLR